MLLDILGWIWVITGILFFLKPGWFRNRLRKKSFKQIRRILFAITITLSVLLIGATWKIPGILAKIILVIGIIGIFKAFFLLKSKAAEKLMNWFLEKPDKIFRVFSVIQIIIGFIIIKV